jgi:hypothetical protein
MQWRFWHDRRGMVDYAARRHTAVDAGGIARSVLPPPGLVFWATAPCSAAKAERRIASALSNYASGILKVAKTRRLRVQPG